MRNILLVSILGWSLTSVPHALAADPIQRLFPCLKPPIGSLADEASRYPLAWNPQSIRWSVSLAGYGQSNPVVWDGSVYVTSVSGPRKETLLVESFRLENGQKRWEHRTESSFPADNTPMISRAAPTPLVDKDGVCVFFESGDLVRLNHSGKVIWKRTLQKDYGEFVNKFGLSSTPCEIRGLLVVLLDHSGKSFLLGIDKTTGKTTFETDRGLRAHSWSSPCIIHVNGEPLVVCSSVGSIDVYSTNGKLITSHTKVGGNSVATPYDLGDGRFLISSLIRPADGPSENANTSNLLGRIVKSTDGYSIQVDWIASEARGSFCSPVEHAGFVYFINPQGVLFCLDAKSGEQHYAKRTPSGACWATPFPVGDRLYLFGKEGTTSVVEIGKEFHLLSEGNKTWAEEIDGEEKETAGPLTRRSSPTLYAGVPTSDGFLIRRGDVLYWVGN